MLSLINKLYEEESQKLEIEFIDLNDFYVKKENINEEELNKFIIENKIPIKKIDIARRKFSVINFIFK